MALSYYFGQWLTQQPVLPYKPLRDKVASMIVQIKRFLRFTRCSDENFDFMPVLNINLFSAWIIIF